MMKPVYVLGLLNLLLLTLLTGAAQAAPALTIGSATAPPGGTATITLTLSGGTEAYTGVNLTLELPTGVTLTGASAGTLLPGFIVNYHQLSDQTTPTAAAVAYSLTAVSAGANGVLLTLQLAVAADAPTGPYPLRFTTSNLFSSSGLSNANGSVSVAHTQVNGVLTIGGNTGNSFLLWTK